MARPQWPASYSEGRSCRLDRSALSRGSHREGLIGTVSREDLLGRRLIGKADRWRGVAAVDSERNFHTMTLYTVFSLAIFFLYCFRKRDGVRIPFRWRFVTAGTDDSGPKSRWIEG